MQISHGGQQLRQAGAHFDISGGGGGLLQMFDLAFKIGFREVEKEVLVSCREFAREEADIFAPLLRGEIGSAEAGREGAGQKEADRKPKAHGAMIAQEKQ